MSLPTMLQRVLERGERHDRRCRAGRRGRPGCPSTPGPGAPPPRTQAGAAMSSRLMPPNTGRRSSSQHGLDDLVGVRSCPHAHGEGIHAGEVLEQQGLALHDRHGGLGTDVAQAQHGGAVARDDGDGVALDRVSSCDQSRGSAAISMHTRATPGVYAIDRSSMSRTGARGSTSILPPLCMVNVRSSQSSTSIPSRARTASRTSCWCSTEVQLTTTSSSRWACFASKPSRAAMLAPASPMAMARRPSWPGRLESRTRIRIEKAAVGVSGIGGRR